MSRHYRPGKGRHARCCTPTAGAALTMLYAALLAGLATGAMTA